MKIVLDTNVLLVSLSRKSPHNWIFQNLIDGQFRLCVTTDILLEYEEIIARHMGVSVAEDTLEVLLDVPTLIRIEKYYQWNLLPNDADDNKFVDCYLAAGADYLVTEDNDFNILTNVYFPKITCIKIDSFAELMNPG